MQFRIIYVEDNEINTLVIQRMFEQSAVELTTISTAEEGIRLARRLRPHLILMDVKLPGMDGVAATRAIKADPELRHIPIIAVTGHGESQAACIEAGCADYLLKPITRAKLLAALQSQGMYL